MMQAASLLAICEHKAGFRCPSDGGFLTET
jgi:hypothetical protein